jgi:hypothetical protein
MSTIVGKPLVTEVDDPVEVVELQIITKAEEWEGLFNRIEVWRSTSSPAGPFEALTAESWMPAVIPNDAGPEPVPPVSGRQVVLGGTQLLIRVDMVDDLVISFADSNPVTYAQAADTITAQSAGRFRAYVDATGKIVVMGVRPGTSAALEITGGDAAPLLGLPTTSPENTAFGRDAHIGLMSKQQQYVFTDMRGSKAYFYRTRFLNTVNHAVSGFSTSFSVGQALGISPTNVVCGYVELVGTDGRPLANQLVQVYAPTQTNLVEGKLVTGPRQARMTDVNGYAEFTMVRGVGYTVSITGTDLVREFVAPTDPNVKIFSLFEKTIGKQSDLFTVVRPALVYAERRTF